MCNDKLALILCRLTTALDPPTFDPGYRDATATEAKTAGPRLVAPCSLKLNDKA